MKFIKAHMKIIVQFCETASPSGRRGPTPTPTDTLLGFVPGPRSGLPIYHIFKSKTASLSELTKCLKSRAAIKRGKNNKTKLCLIKHWITIRYDTRCNFNVRSKADMSRLNLPHGNDN